MRPLDSPLFVNNHTPSFELYHFKNGVCPIIFVMSYKRKLGRKERKRRLVLDFLVGDFTTYNVSTFTTQ